MGRNPLVATDGALSTRTLAAAAAILAGFIHFRVAPEHFTEAFEFGVFMVAVGAVQVIGGILLQTRPSRQLIVGMIGFTLLVMVIYILSRTTGLPFGPSPGAPEPVGPIDVSSKLAELALLMALLRLARASRLPPPE